MVVGFFLYRVLLNDLCFVVLILLILCVFVLSDLMLKKSWWSMSLVVGFVLVVHYMFFYEVG